MAEDLALWGFVLGAIGTVLSSVLAISQLADRLRARSDERVGKVKAILQEILGPIHSLDHEFTDETVYSVIPVLQEKRDRVLGLGPTLTKVAPEIAKDLAYLIGLVGIEMGPLLSYESKVTIMKDNKVKTVIPRLHTNIEKWLSDHA